jgi:hypothetical protein
MSKHAYVEPTVHVYFNIPVYNIMFRTFAPGRGWGVHVQGGALNRGLFFAGPPPSPLWAVSGKISEIR